MHDREYIPLSRSVLIVALVHFLLHIFTNGNYGMFRDEFYYLACADHLAWGYVDHPPLSIFILKAWTTIFGDSVWTIRVPVAFAGFFLVLLAGDMARRMRGATFAQTIAAIATAISPTYLVVTGFFSMNAFDLLVWATTFWILIRILGGGSTKLWLLLGLVLGLGLLNKISVIILIFSVVVALLAAGRGRLLLHRHAWGGAAIAALFFVPHVLWQISSGWPTLEFMANAKQYKIAGLSPLEFLLGNIVENHPANFIVWAAGLGFLLFAKRARAFRPLGLVYLTAFLVFAVQQSKVYYLSPAYTFLYAAGGVALGCFLHDRGWTWARPVLLVLLIAPGIILLPLGVPILPVEKFLSYNEAIGLKPTQAENTEMGDLPQHYADRFGWEEMTGAIEEVYRGLTPEERAGCAILAGNYGEAGAYAYFSRGRDLPPVICGHNSYWHWGYGDPPPETLIIIGGTVERVREAFDDVRRGGEVRLQYVMPYERHMELFVATRLKLPIEEAWRWLRFYI